MAQEWICKCEVCNQMLRIDLDKGKKFKCHRCGNIIEYIDFVEKENESENNVEQNGQLDITENSTV